jgi:hypothetical protein
VGVGRVGNGDEVGIGIGGGEVLGEGVLGGGGGGIYGQGS